MTPHIFAVTAFIVFIALGLACATAPSGPPPLFRINTKPAEEGFLQGKKTVILNIKTAERGSASLMDRQGSGGIFSVIEGGARLGRLITYNNRAKNFDKVNEADLNEALLMMGEIIALTWGNAYNAETVQAEYNFGKAKPSIVYYNKPNAALKKEMADICAANNAELAVSILQQITHGYLDEAHLSIASKLIAITHISSEICVFDKKGELVIQASAKLPNVSAGLTYGYNLSPNNGDDYAQLYLDGFGNILSAILDFDSSAAFSMEDLIDNLIIHLNTSEDID